MSSIAIVHKDLADEDRGGVSVLFKAHIKELLRRSWTVHVLSQHPFSLPGIQSHVLPTERDPVLHSENVTKHLNKLDIQLIEASNWKSEILHYCQTQRTSKKVATIVRCDPPATVLFPGEERLERLEAELFHLATVRIAVSSFAQRRCTERYGPAPCFVVHNGIDHEWLECSEGPLSSGELWNSSSQQWIRLAGQHLKTLLDPHRPNVLWIGKPTWMKGYDLFLKLLETLHPFAKIFALMGEASSSFNPKDLNGRATLLRRLSRADLNGIRKSMTCCLITSRVEGFCLALVESLALGIPVLANNRCEVFSEFLPNPLLHLSDLNNQRALLNTLASLPLTISTPTLAPTRFTSNRMTKNSIDIYRELLCA